MAQIQNVRQLSRARNLQIIRDACHASGNVELEHIVQLVKATASRPCARDCHDTRDRVLLIAATWSLDCQGLDQQPDECLAAIVGLIKRA